MEECSSGDRSSRSRPNWYECCRLWCAQNSSSRPLGAGPHVSLGAGAVTAVMAVSPATPLSAVPLPCSRSRPQKLVPLKTITLFGRQSRRHLSPPGGAAHSKAMAPVMPLPGAMGSQRLRSAPLASRSPRHAGSVAVSQRSAIRGRATYLTSVASVDRSQSSASCRAERQCRHRDAVPRRYRSATTSGGRPRAGASGGGPSKPRESGRSPARPPPGARLRAPHRSPRS
jgi:hypothetical protein